MSENNTQSDNQTDQDLVHSAERKLKRLEDHLKGLGDQEAIEICASLHRRLKRCLDRFNSEHAGDNQLTLLSGGGK